MQLPGVHFEIQDVQDYAQTIDLPDEFDESFQQQLGGWNYSVLSFFLSGGTLVLGAHIPGSEFDQMSSYN